MKNFLLPAFLLLAISGAAQTRAPRPRPGNEDPAKRQERFYKTREDATIINHELARWKAFGQSKAEMLRTEAALPVANWQSCGPANQGGRMISFAFDPTNSQTIWAGSASGGLWRSMNGGNSWQAMSDNIPSLAIGAIGINPASPNVMLLGTGEGYVLTPLLQSGVGVLKSVDGGLTWGMTALNVPDSLGFASLNFAWDPVNTNNVYLASTIGILVSNDQGNTWALTLPGVATSLAMNPQSPAVLYASLQYFSWAPNAGIFKSTDGGQTWTQLGNGLPSANVIGFTCLSLCDSFPDVLYAGISGSTIAGTFGKLHGLYKTSDGGATWTMLPNTVDFYCYPPPYDYICQGWYGNVVKVMPADSNKVFAGGVNFYKSFNGGNTWNFSDNSTSESYGYMHPDFHYVAVDPSDPFTMYTCNDAGIYKTTNGGLNWIRKDSGLVTAQYYYVASSFSNPDLAIGGTQDNGVFFNYSLGASPGWSQPTSGDGFACRIDHTNDQVLFYTELYKGRMKSTDGGASFTPVNNGINDPNYFFMPLIMHPVNSQVLLTATDNYIYQTTDGAMNWSSIFNVQYITILEYDKVNPDIIYASTDPLYTSSDVYRSMDGGITWLQITSPSDKISDIETDPVTTGLLYATCNKYAAGQQVWKSVDSGMTWTSISSGFPGIPANTIVINPNNHDHLYVGSDLGVYLSIDRGVSWSSYNDNLPNVHVLDMHYHAADSSLRAGTHGRGFWKTPAADPALVSLQDVHAPVTGVSAYPNPSKGEVTITYTLAQNSSVTVKVLNQLGQEVGQVFAGNQQAGTQTITWDGRNANGGAVQPGVYFVRVISGDKATATKVVISG